MALTSLLLQSSGFATPSPTFVSSREKANVDHRRIFCVQICHLPLVRRQTRDRVSTADILVTYMCVAPFKT